MTIYTNTVRGGPLYLISSLEEMTIIFFSRRHTKSPRLSSIIITRCSRSCSHSLSQGWRNRVCSCTPTFWLPLLEKTIHIPQIWDEHYQSAHPHFRDRVWIESKNVTDKKCHTYLTDQWNVLESCRFIKPCWDGVFNSMNLGVQVRFNRQENVEVRSHTGNLGVMVKTPFKDTLKCSN